MKLTDLKVCQIEKYRSSKKFCEDSFHQKKRTIDHKNNLIFRWGDSRSDGSQITLTQSDKWLRQAGVIDGWLVTTTDTAIFFRKFSRGSIWLEYNDWRLFLEELAGKKGLDMREVIDKLELCGKPRVSKPMTM